jgi:hypothetical protein
MNEIASREQIKLLEIAEMANRKEDVCVQC